jgi:hypothetical protein
MVIRSRKSKKDRQYNGKKKKAKMTNNDLHNTTQKTKDRVTRTNKKTGRVSTHVPRVVIRNQLCSLGQMDVNSVVLFFDLMLLS